MQQHDPISSHYNKLRESALYARSIASAYPADSGKPRPGKAYLDLASHSALAKRLAASATELAAADWRRVQARAADQHGSIPDYPIRFGDSGSGSGFAARRYGYTEICTNRKVVPCDGPILDREAVAAEAEYEAYRLAVSQGVAVAPAEAV